MPALTADRNTPYREGSDFEFPVAAATKIFAGSIVGFNAGAAFASKGVVSTTFKTAGVAIETADNAAGAAGDIRTKVRRGVWRFANSAAADLITLADVGGNCYIVDDQTVAKTDGTATRSVAGKIRDVDAAGVWVEFNAELGKLAAAAALDFAAIAAAGSADLAIAVAGAEVGDTVSLGLPAAPTAGLVFQAFVSAAGTVTVRATNITAAAVDAAAATYRVTVHKL